MNRNEYLDRLASLLREFDREYQQEIFEAVNAHFEEGLREGRTEEEIASDLGLCLRTRGCGARGVHGRAAFSL